MKLMCGGIFLTFNILLHTIAYFLFKKLTLIGFLKDIGIKFLLYISMIDLINTIWIVKIFRSLKLNDEIGNIMPEILQQIENAGSTLRLEEFKM